MNTTVPTNVSRPPVFIEQGPEWLVQIYLEPPAWLNPSLQALAAIVFAIVMYRLYQSNWKIGLDTQREMQSIVAVIVGVTITTTTMMSWFEFSYLIDVSIGFLVGYGPVEVLHRWPQIIPWAIGPETKRQRVTAIWFSLGILVMAYPAVIRSEGLGLGGGRLYLLGLTFGLVLYNSLIENVDIKQLGNPEIQ